MTERFMLDDAGELIDLNTHKFIDYGEECCNLLNALHEENEQLKQIPIKLDNRIEKLQEDLQKLSEMDTADLNQQAVEDVATVIGMSLNALMEFRKELKGD
jgi:cell shape-determining protein MreC